MKFLPYAHDCTVTSRWLWQERAEYHEVIAGRETIQNNEIRALTEEVLREHELSDLITELMLDENYYNDPEVRDEILDEFLQHFFTGENRFDLLQGLEQEAKDYELGAISVLEFQRLQNFLVAQLEEFLAFRSLQEVSPTLQQWAEQPQYLKPSAKQPDKPVLPTSNYPGEGPKITSTTHFMDCVTAMAQAYCTTYAPNTPLSPQQLAENYVSAHDAFNLWAYDVDQDGEFSPAELVMIEENIFNFFRENDDRVKRNTYTPDRRLDQQYRETEKAQKALGVCQNIRARGEQLASMGFPALAKGYTVIGERLYLAAVQTERNADAALNGGEIHSLSSDDQGLLDTLLEADVATELSVTGFLKDIFWIVPLLKESIGLADEALRDMVHFIIAIKGVDGQETDSLAIKGLKKALFPFLTTQQQQKINFAIAETVGFADAMADAVVDSGTGSLQMAVYATETFRSLASAPKNVSYIIGQAQTVGANAVSALDYAFQNWGKLTQGISELRTNIIDQNLLGDLQSALGDEHSDKLGYYWGNISGQIASFFLDFPADIAQGKLTAFTRLNNNLSFNRLYSLLDKSKEIGDNKGRIEKIFSDTRTALMEESILGELVAHVDEILNTAQT